jgi:hypothetical protein
VRFVDGQRLAAADLSDEQSSQLARQRRHAIGPHTWGIVEGGELGVDDDGVVTVGPVLAYDGYGRELVLAEPHPPLPTAERFELLNTDVLDVWLVYRRDPVDAPLAEPSCGGDEQAGRWSEVPLVRFTAATGGPVAAQRPPGVPAGDIPFPPSRMPPDDPTREWPVFLGRTHRSPGQPPRPYAYRADDSGRPYVGARAASIEPPWGAQEGALLELDPAQGTALELAFLDSAGGRNALVSVSDVGDLELTGSARIAGEWTVGGGRVTLEPGSAPAGSEWRLSHVDAQGQAPAELRIEIGASPGRVVIGSWSEEQNAFVPHLTIEDSGQVVVAGDLRVLGNLEADFFAARQVYLAGLAALGVLNATRQAIRARITDADYDLSAELNWP